MSVLNNIDEEIEREVTIKRICEDAYHAEIEFFNDLRNYIVFDAALDIMSRAVNDRLKEYNVRTAIDHYEIHDGKPNKIRLYVKVVHCTLESWLNHGSGVWMFEYVI